MAKYTCPHCGFSISGNLVLPIRCCPASLEVPNHCPHRGLSVGTASCGCGAIYRCNLLDKYCADRPLAFPLYEINVAETGVLLSRDYQSDSRAVSESFQACSDCEHYPISANSVPKTCTVCKQPSTRICSEHSSFGMCGEPLCDNCRCPRHGL